MYVKSLRKRLCMRHALYLAAQSKTLNMSGLWRELHNEMGACMWVCEGVTLNLAACFCQAANHSVQRPLKATGFLPQQVGSPRARMEKSPGDQVDGVGALLCPSPNEQSKGRDVGVLGNLTYRHSIPSLEEVWLEEEPGWKAGSFSSLSYPAVPEPSKPSLLVLVSPALWDPKAGWKGDKSQLNRQPSDLLFLPCLPRAKSHWWPHVQRCSQAGCKHLPWGDRWNTWTFPMFIYYNQTSRIVFLISSN